MGRKRKELASLDSVEAMEPSAVDAADENVLVEAEMLPSEVVVEESAPVAAPTKWVVLEDAEVSLFGQMTVLPAGTVVSAASYGPNGIKRIMEQKVALAPVA